MQVCHRRPGDDELLRGRRRSFPTGGTMNYPFHRQHRSQMGSAGGEVVRRTREFLYNALISCFELRITRDELQ